MTIADRQCTYGPGRHRAAASDGHGLFVNPAPPDPRSMTGHKLPVAERTVSAGRYPDIIEQGGLGAAFTQLTQSDRSRIVL
jgi:hypothetical protein